MKPKLQNTIIIPDRPGYVYTLFFTIKKTHTSKTIMGRVAYNDIRLNADSGSKSEYLHMKVNLFQSSEMIVENFIFFTRISN